MQTSLYINGNWATPIEGGTLPMVDPATVEVFHHFPATTTAEVAVAAPRATFTEAPWGG